MGTHFKGNYSCYDLHMKLFNICSIILPILWGTLCSIMIFRILLRVDFNLVNSVQSAYKDVESQEPNEVWADHNLLPTKEHPTTYKVSELKESDYQQ